MPRFTVGDRVRVDIPNEVDPDHDRYHGRHGTVVEIFEDDAAEETGRELDAFLFTIEFDSEDTMDFRGRDLRPPLE
ncbi:hypothetical protein ACFQGT_09945 [Natrialbaceae archaeon GCM10025810]|uniref:hypothetical protein n=1 Tax=Halovalidus salilacus TaxID=3075124 RepID=UPI003620050F